MKLTMAVLLTLLIFADEVDQQQHQEDMNGYEEQQPTHHQLDMLPQQEEELKQQQEEAFYQQQQQQYIQRYQHSPFLLDRQQQQQQQQMMQQVHMPMMGGQQQQMEQQQKHYFDSIETDEFVMPSMFEVEIRLPDNQIKIVTVEVDKASKQKPYLGGFRNNRTGQAFHHAFSQTDQTANYHPEKNERQVQTYQYKTKSTIMMREFGVQMEKTGLFIDTRQDKIIYPKPYFSSEMWKKQREEITLFIQCHVRAWFARKQSNALRKLRDDRDMELLRKQEELRQQEEKKHKVEIERRMHPKQYKDFEILYNELEAWRLNETKKIKNSTDLKEDEKKLALQQLLHKETKILQQIDKLKITANSQNKEDKINNFLKAMSDPKLWKRIDGRYTEVHTPFSTRAKELMDLYNGLRLPFLSTDERLDVLLHTKWTVKEFDCNLTREVVDLIDREADMLNRGRSESSLEGLRKRLSNLFLQFIETPEFNPEAARFQKVPRELLQQTQSIIFE